VGHQYRRISARIIHEAVPSGGMVAGMACGFIVVMEVQNVFTLYSN